MPRKKVLAAPLEPSADYWTKFLSAQGLSGLPSKSKLKTSPFNKKETFQPIAEGSAELTSDQWRFIHRVAEALVPVAGYSPDIKKKLIRTREIYRKGLEDVFKEKRDFKEWFTDTRRKCAIREVELMDILHECLQGLQSKESQELKEQFGKVVNRMQMARAGMVR